MSGNPDPVQDTFASTDLAGAIAAQLSTRHGSDRAALRHVMACVLELDILFAEIEARLVQRKVLKDGPSLARELLWRYIDAREPG
ncbi:hypothetical protein [Bradyrhizobium brasilense]|uniref:Uncharacterized protein n=1 Tax=Bradyrhizobium brasilense TaxID=1419277 RepID=A0A1G7NKE3_9BRAD|nr:hypothetical protein [Bradyrhizobium brasilense]MCC8976137.1 hypothetical protein [Bradyrhizobium brasilense]SDF74544.1 hypothetical protein SAMN05216337_107110 [Bradyrhizobium brasilense]